MDAAAIEWLTTAGAAPLIASAQHALDAGESTLRIVERLRGTVTPEQASAIIGLSAGRRAARGKFPDADALWFDRPAAEQATPADVARYVAKRFADTERIADLGCGAGADSLALAELAPVVAVDRNDARLAMLRANAATRGLTDRIEAVSADLRDYTLPAEVDAVWLDPGRRDERGRVLDPARWTPPLDTAIAIARSVRRAGIKLAPGIDLDAIPPDAEIEFISLHGDLVVAVAWFGAARTVERRATVLPVAASLTSATPASLPAIAPPGAVLYDPDPGIGRAGLVDVLAASLDAWQLDATIAYLSSDGGRETPFARRFSVERWLRFSERALLAALRDLDARRVEVMRRGSPVDTNALERRLNRSLAGTRVLTVALTRCRGEQIAIVCERVRP